MTTQEIEQPLLIAMDQVHIQYQEVDRLLADLRPAFHQGADPTPELSKLALLMGRIGVIEANAAAVRETWKRRKVSPSPQLRQVLDRQKTQLEGVLRVVQELEGMARESQRRLAPQLDASVTASSGHAAYGRTMQRAERARAS